jgi:hypothetical protein
MAKGSVTLDDDDRKKRWAEYQKYLDRLDSSKHDLSGLRDLLKDQKLDPSSKQFERLKVLRDRLEELQEKDFMARQLKDEIDRAINNAGPGLMGAFAKLAKSDTFDED